MKKPLAYVSGPISGLPDNNEPAFRDAALKLKKMGYNVFVPHDLKPNIDNSLVNLLTEKEWDSYVWRKYMDLCLPKLVECQVLCALPGWSASDGASCEINTTIGMKMPWYNLDKIPPAAELDLRHDFDFMYKTGRLK